LEAQPEQLDSVVNRIFFSEGVSLFIVVIVFTIVKEECEAQAYY
jgi:hypothetical protein